MSVPLSTGEALRTALELAAATDGEPADRLLRVADAYLTFAQRDPEAFVALVGAIPEREIPGRETLHSLCRDGARAQGVALADAETQFSAVWAVVHAAARAGADATLAGEATATAVARRTLGRQVSALLSSLGPPPPPAAEAPPVAAAEPVPPPEGSSPGDPVIYDFLHYREYVREWLRVRAGRPSLRMVAGRINRAPSFLSSVLAGDRDLNEFDAQSLAAELGLDAKGRRYFTDLVEYDQAGPIVKRTAALDRLTATRRFHQAPRMADIAWAVFRAWYVPAICELVLCEGFQEDPEWIAQALRPAITPSQAREALALLLEMKLLERDGDGRLRPAAPLLLTDHEVQRMHSLALGGWHLWLAERAAHALDTLPPHQRHFAAATFAASPELLAEMKGRITRFMEEAVSRGTSHPEPRTRVYQMAFQLVPLSRELGEEPPTGS